ncbi:hypothetical protein FRB90_009930 [Tulasnella sp. 427]|nr:hypothetical protein FRB90_009930 [Tulasnella sp. 427]
MLSVLRGIIGNAGKVAEALIKCQAALAAKCPMSSSLEALLTLYPRCIWDREELRKPQYKAEASRSVDIHSALSQARVALDDVLAQYTRITTLECGDDLAVTKTQFGVPCSFLFALQLKACLKYLKEKKREKNPLRTREVATALLEDIEKSGEKLEPHVACKDVVNQCRKLAAAIRADTVWPQPYVGREADADVLLRLAHNVLCPPTRTQVVDSLTYVRISRLRTLIVTFLSNDAKQTTPLISRRQVAFASPSPSNFASPAHTATSLSSTLSMKPSSVAGWYFAYQPLALDLEVNGVDVGRGGFSNVHKAKWMGMDVAVKVIRGSAGEDGAIDPSTLRKVKREKTVWRDMYHQYILPFFGVAEWDGQDALISPWIPHNRALKHFEHLSESNRRRRRELNQEALTDECIAERLKFVSTLSLGQEVVLLTEIQQITEAACGILHLHKKNVVHGDIRMGNILVSPGGEPLITDFGLSKLLGGSFDTQPSTAFERAGTTRWMAPELHENQPCRTKQSDVWAFACTVLELFSGCYPYYNDRNLVFYNKIDEGIPPDIPPQLQQRIPALWTVLRGCWAKRPQDRPPMEVILTSLMMIRTSRSWMIDAVNSS